MDSLVKEVHLIKEEMKTKESVNEDLRKETQRLTAENEVLINAKVRDHRTSLIFYWLDLS